MSKKQGNANTDRREIEDDPRVRRRQLAAILVVLVVLPAAVYGRVVGFDFVNYDDWEYVTQNPHVAKGLTGNTLAWAFTTTEMANWHPLTYLSYLLDAQLFGVRGGPFHAVNLLFHVANTLLLFAVLRQMTGAIWRSALAAALFAIHPQHVESVAWVSERKDVLSVFFGLLAIGAYTNFARRNSMRWYAVTFLSFGFSLLSKVTLVTLPFLLLLLDWWPLERTKPHVEDNPIDNGITNRQASLQSFTPGDIRRNGMRLWMRLFLEKLPFILLAAIFSAIAVVAQGDAVASIRDDSLMLRVGNAVVAYCLYIVRIFLPIGLGVMYPHPGNTLPAWQIAVSILFLAAATAAAIGLRKKYPYLLVGWFWFLGTMVPMIGIMQVGVQQMADRYAYFPLIGLYVCLAWGLNSFVGADANRRRIAGVAAAAFVAIMAAVAWAQVGYWRNGETLFRRTLDVTTDNPIAHINLAQAIHHAAMQAPESKAPATTVKSLKEAIEHYERALSLDDRYVLAHKNLAKALSQVNELTRGSGGPRIPESAIDHYREALRLEPESGGNDVIHFEIGNLLANLSRFREAQAEFEKAIELSPDYAAAYLNLGRVLAAQDRFPEAIQQEERSLQLFPGWQDAIHEISTVHLQFGAALAAQNKIDDAIVQFRRSIASSPNSPNGHYLLGRALAKTGRRDEALEHLNIAVQRSPNIPEVHYELGVLLLEMGQRQAAIAHLREAVRLRPDDAQSKQALQRALSAS